MPKLSPIRGRELIALLEKKGFQNIHQKGSHVRMAHSDGRKTTIPLHSGEKVGVGLLRKILRDTNISRDEFEKLKNKFTDASSAPVEFACIFCQSEGKYELFTNSIKPLGKIVEDTKSGFTYFLDKPISTISGPLRLVKIRKPDIKFSQRGDADFNTDYKKFKNTY